MSASSRSAVVGWLTVMQHPQNENRGRRDDRRMRHALRAKAAGAAVAGWGRDLTAERVESEVGDREVRSCRVPLKREPGITHRIASTDQHA